ncbi:MAG: hypothetical protein ACN2B6_02915 [Rickettsiales bacterium]
MIAGTALSNAGCNKLPPPPALTATEMATAAIHKQRIATDIAGLTDEEIGEYFVNEIKVAASLHARIALGDLPKGVDSDIVSRASALAELLSEQSDYVYRRATLSLHPRKAMLKTRSPVINYQRDALQVLSTSYDDPEQALSDAQKYPPEKLELIYDDILSAIKTMCDRIPNKRKQGPARGAP